MDKIKSAHNVFASNFNCAQAVLSSFCEELGLDTETALKIATCFGGGMRCGELCGAVTGAQMAIGLKYGHYISDDLETKNNCYAKACEFNDKFKQKNGSLICRELLGYDARIPEQAQKIKELDLHNKLCPALIASAIEIAEEILL